MVVDRVPVYLPRIPEQFVTVLARAKIGAIHTVVYFGFSGGALQERPEESNLRHFHVESHPSSRVLGHDARVAKPQMRPVRLNS